MRRDILTGGAVFVLSFTVYVVTLCPTIYWEDSAAFCAVHSLLGIPHSPGFPVYVLLGRLFTLLPFAGSAFYSNLMSAFWGSAALSMMFFLILEIQEQAQLDQWLSKLTAITAILFLGFSSSFWLQTIRAEVYSLNIFFILVLTYLVLKWRRSRSDSNGTKALLLFFFILGLSLTNHPLLIVTLVPGFLLFILLTDYGALLNPKRLVLLTVFFLLGMSFYLYLPIRSGLLPAINWGKPDSWSNLVAYLLRTSQAGVTPSVVDVPYLNRFWFNLSFPVDQFGLPLFWLGVVGAVSMFRSSRLALLLTFSVFSLNVLTATWATDFSVRNYDLLGYLLPSLCMFTIWFALGLRAVLAWILKESRIININPKKEISKVLTHLAAYTTFLVVLLLPAFQLGKNVKQCNKRSQIWAYTYASQTLSNVEKNAMILVGDDNTLTSLWYLNLCENRRPDVKILSMSALINPAYREQLRHQYPQIKLPNLSSQDLGALAWEVLRLNAGQFPVYSTYFSSHPLLADHLRPAGFLFELSPQKVTLTDKDTEVQRAFLKQNLKADGYDIVAREHLGNLVFNLGVFYDRTLGSNLSVEYFLWALDVDPSNARIYFQLGKAFLNRGDKDKAQQFIQAGLELEPYNLEAKKLLKMT
jgi:hypothetical protein